MCLQLQGCGLDFRQVPQGMYGIGMTCGVSTPLIQDVFRRSGITEQSIDGSQEYLMINSCWRGNLLPVFILKSNSRRESGKAWSQGGLSYFWENHFLQIKYTFSQNGWKSYLREVPCFWPVLWFSQNPHRHQCLQAAEVVQDHNSSERQCHGLTEGSRGKRGIEGWMGGKKQEARVIGQIIKALNLLWYN